MKTIRNLCLGNLQDAINKLPEEERERAAYQIMGNIINEKISIKIWPSREALKTTMRMQAKKETGSNFGNWIAIKKFEYL